MCTMLQAIAYVTEERSNYSLQLCGALHRQRPLPSAPPPSPPLIFSASASITAKKGFAGSCDRSVYRAQLPGMHTARPACTSAEGQHVSPTMYGVSKRGHARRTALTSMLLFSDSIPLRFTTAFPPPIRRSGAGIHCSRNGLGEGTQRRRRGLLFTSVAFHRRCLLSLSEAIASMVGLYLKSCN